MGCNFSFKHYEEIMKLIKEKGYISTFYNEDIKGKQIIVRHDIDLDLDAALEMAKIEKKSGIKAVYFIWIGSPFYNIFEKRYKNVIKEIMELGHEIGLHYDETSNMCNSKDELIEYIDKESEVIKTYFNIDIKTVSFHRPSKYILESDINCGKYINTYSKKFISDFKYLSDSRGQWRNGCFCNLLKDENHEKIQFLTHPIWWKNNSVSNQDRLQEFLEYKLRKMSGDISDNITIYNKKNFILKENENED